MTFETQVGRAILERVSEVAPPLLDIDELRRRGRVQARRRTAGWVATAAALVVGITWAATVPGRTGNTTPPVDLPPVNTDSVRPLVYADGSELHWGDKVVQASQAPTSLAVTDYGVAFATAEGDVWFTAGDAPERIGTTNPDLAVRWEVSSVVSQATGPEVEWFTEDGDGGIDVVVYDTRSSKETRRVATGVAADCEGECAEIFGVHDGRLYWTDRACRDECRGFPRTHDDESNVTPTPTTRETDLASGDDRLLGSQDFRDVVKTWPRIIELRQASGRPMDETSDDYDIGDGTGLQLGGWPGIDVAGPAPGELVRFVVDIDTPVVLRGQGAAPRTPDYRLSQWLDDDTVALVSYRFSRDSSGVTYSTVLTCRLAEQTCAVTVPAPRSGSRVVPSLS